MTPHTSHPSQLPVNSGLSGEAGATRPPHLLLLTSTHLSLIQLLTPLPLTGPPHTLSSLAAPGPTQLCVRAGLAAAARLGLAAPQRPLYPANPPHNTDAVSDAQDGHRMCSLSELVKELILDTVSKKIYKTEFQNSEQCASHPSPLLPTLLRCNPQTPHPLLPTPCSPPLLHLTPCSP